MEARVSSRPSGLDDMWPFLSSSMRAVFSFVSGTAGYWGSRLRGPQSARLRTQPASSQQVKKESSDTIQHLEHRPLSFSPLQLACRRCA